MNEESLTSRVSWKAKDSVNLLDGEGAQNMPSKMFLTGHPSPKFYQQCPVERFDTTHSYPNPHYPLHYENLDPFVQQP